MQCSIDDCERPVVAWGWCDTHRKIAKKVVSVYPRTCDQCSAAYVGRRSTSQFCSRKCKERSSRASGKQYESVRRWQLKTKYGITPEAYQELRDAQGRACAICHRLEPIGRVSKFTEDYWLHVDHDHETGRVRGLLCHECNVTLGKVKDDVAILRAMIDYLDCAPM